MRLSSTLSTAALAVSALAADCPEITPSGDAITGFRFQGDCDTWKWWSRDKGTAVDLQPDCQLRQTWPNPTPVQYVCIKPNSGANKCFGAPGAGVGSCTIPPSHCASINNMWGWGA
ncbi:hypothetical protein ColTof4_00073 [Colletotrichum tofieldiae]|nr:hypothetical protein ColTof4_00073 [Colletotrichum tofieldiae]